MSAFALLDARRAHIGRSYYDLALNPPSFNFVDHMLVSERWRIANGYETVEFVCLPGPVEGFRNDRLPPAGGAERTRWLNNIVIPMPRLLQSCGKPAVLDPAARGPGFARGQYRIGFKSLVESARADCYPLVAPPDMVEDAKRKWGEKYVTITHRDVGWWQLRKPQLNEWRLAADELERAGYAVVLIPEGTKADEPVPGWQTDPYAGRNSVARAALYAGASMNFGIPSGPMWMCWFLGVPCIVMRMSDERKDTIGNGGRELDNCTREQSLRNAGLNRGQSLPNARPRQKIVWVDDTHRNILNAFEDVMR